MPSLVKSTILPPTDTETEATPFLQAAKIGCALVIFLVPTLLFANVNPAVEETAQFVAWLIIGFVGCLVAPKALFKLYRATTDAFLDALK